LHNIIGELEVKSLVQKAYFRTIRVILVEDDRHHIPYVEYLGLCADYGLSRQETTELSRAMHLAGIVLHFHNNPDLKGTLFLKPLNVIKNITEHLNLRYLKKGHADLERELIELKTAIKPLYDVKNSLEGAANKYASRVMVVALGYISVQFAILGRMVWWEFNWDIMEPITYFVTLGTIMLGYAIFVMTEKDYTYNGLKQRVMRRKLRSLYLDAAFNWPEWNKLDKRIKQIEEQLGLAAPQKNL